MVFFSILKRIRKIKIEKIKTTFLRGIPDSENLFQFLESHTPSRSVIFCGRSNVGKSSLINCLFGKKVARTSNTPGRTREINVFHFYLSGIQAPFTLFDLPGYGFAEVSKAQKKVWNLLMVSFFEKLTPDHLILNIQDARHPFQTADNEFIQFIEQFNLTGHLLFNKIDKLKTQKERNGFEKIKKENFDKISCFKNYTLTSAEKGTGLKDIEILLSNFMTNSKS